MSTEARGACACVHVTHVRAVARAAPSGLLLAILVPKCPLCLAAYLSSLGLGAELAQQSAPWLRTLGIALAGAALVCGVGARLLAVLRTRATRGECLDPRALSSSSAAD
jgi:hypothetical protein